MKMIKTIKSLPMAVAAAAVLAMLPSPSGGAAYASQDKKPSAISQAKTRKVPAMSLETHKHIQKAQEAMDAKDYDTAKKILADVLERKHINDYERAITWQLRAMIAYDEDDTKGTIAAYEKILQYRDSIPVALETNIIYGLAQLYYSIENYDKSLAYVKEWQSQVDPSLISVSNLVFISQLYYTRNDFKTCIEYINKAIKQAQATDLVEVKEQWYQLALSAYWELGEFKKVRDVLETLLINWPKPRYWQQLAAVYQELGDETTSYALTEAAYKQGFLDDKPAQLVNVAQIQIVRGAPIKCAWILDKAFKEKRIERNAKNLRLLGQCYMMANEWAKAIAPMTESAKLESDVDLWMQIGQVQMQLDHYNDAITSFGEALDGLKSDKSNKALHKRLTALMQRGTAFTELKKFADAHKEFDTAAKLAKDKKDKNTVRQWQNYLKAEEAREKMLTG